MATVVLNLEGGNSGILGDVNNVSAVAPGVIVANAVDYDDAGLTGISISCPHVRTATEFNGRDVGDNQLIQDINQNGQYYNGVFQYEITVPVNFTSCDITPHLTTDFTGQDSLVIRVNGVVAVPSWDASGNTTGAFPTINGVTPDGDNRIVVEIDNSAGSGFVYSCGLRLLNITSAEPSNIIGQIIEFNTFNSVSDGSPGIQQIGQIVESNIVSPVSQGGGAFTDYFNGDGSFADWNEYNPSAMPNAARVGGQFQSGTISAQGSSLWWQTDRGYLLWKEVPFPQSGYTEIIAYNLGIGPATDPSQNKSWDGNSDFSFATFLVHDIDETRQYWEKCSIGQRADSNPNTLEAKRTTNGSSNQFDVGPDAFGAGVTKGDVRLRITSSRELLWAFRPVGGSSWTVLNAGTGYDGKPYAGDLPFSGDSVRVGLSGYAYASVATPFVAHCDAIVMTGESTDIVQTIGLITEANELQAVGFGVGSPVTQVIGLITEDNVLNALVSNVPVSQVIGQITEQNLLHSFGSALEGFWSYTPPGHRIIDLEEARRISHDKDARLNYWLNVGETIGSLTVNSVDIDPDQLIDSDGPSVAYAGFNDSEVTDNDGNTYPIGTLIGVTTSGGLNNRHYDVVLRLGLNSGESDDRTFYLEVTDR